MKKRILSLAIVLALSLALVPAAFAARTYTHKPGYMPVTAPDFPTLFDVVTLGNVESTTQDLPAYRHDKADFKRIHPVTVWAEWRTYYCPGPALVRTQRDAKIYLAEANGVADTGLEPLVKFTDLWKKDVGEWTLSVPALYLIVVESDVKDGSGNMVELMFYVEVTGYKAYLPPLTAMLGQLSTRRPPDPTPGLDLPYIVQRGETLESIAYNYYGSAKSAATIRSANSQYLASTKGILEAGVVIKLPAKGLIAPLTPHRTIDAAGYYMVRSGDTLNGIATRFYGDAVGAVKLQEANAARVKNGALPQVGQWIIIPW